MRRLWSDWADAQADRSLRWAHSHFVGFVMSRIIYKILKNNIDQLQPCMISVIVGVNESMLTLEI